MRYIKYIRYITIFVITTIILLMITLLKYGISQETYAGVMNNSILGSRNIDLLIFIINDFVYGLLMSICTGILVYISTAIHSEKIEFYKNERDMVIIVGELQKYRNKITRIVNNMKDMPAEDMLNELNQFRDYCNKIIHFFYLLGLENCRSGWIEDLCNRLIYWKYMKHIRDCEHIWRNLESSIEHMYKYRNNDVDIIADGVLMQTLIQIDDFLKKHTSFLGGFTSAIFCIRKAFPSKRKLCKYIKREPFYKDKIGGKRVENTSVLQEYLQHVLKDSECIIREEREKFQNVERRTTYRYVFSKESLYLELLKKFEEIGNIEAGLNLGILYSSVQEKQTLSICIDDLVNNGYISLKKFDARELHYITKKGINILEKFQSDEIEGNELYLDMRTEIEITDIEIWNYEGLEKIHIKRLE